MLAQGVYLGGEGKGSEKTKRSCLITAVIKLPPTVGALHCRQQELVHQGALGASAEFPPKG